MDRWEIFLRKSKANAKFGLKLQRLIGISLFYFARYFAALKTAEYRDIDATLQHQAFEWFEKFVNMYTACDTWFEVSCRKYDNFTPCPGDAHLNWKGRGACTVLDLLQVTNWFIFTTISFGSF